MLGSAVSVLMSKAERAGSALRWRTPSGRIGMLICVALAIFAMLAAPSQACGRHHAEADSVVHGSSLFASMAEAAHVSNMINRCGAPGPSDQDRCACCTTNSPMLKSAGLAQTFPSGRAIEIAARESLFASLGSIPELPPPILVV
jgi:hypothetical protein